MGIYTFYKITCNEENDFTYVGSTINFKSRKCQHKSTCSQQNDKNHNVKVYLTIREFGGWDNWTMSPIENLECASKIDALIREQYWIDEFKPKLNCNNAYGLNNDNMKMENAKKNREVYREKNRDKKKEQNRKYRAENRDKISEQKKETYQKNPEFYIEKSKKYGYENRDIIKARRRQQRLETEESEKEIEKTMKKIYYEDNLTRFKERSKEYYEKNRELLITNTKEYRTKNLEKIKKYRTDNRDKITARRREIYAAKKAALNPVIENDLKDNIESI
jgi:hypothetical protein